MAKAKLATSYTMEEQLCANLAREWGPDDQIAVTGVVASAFVAAGLAERLKKTTFGIIAEAKGRVAMLSNIRLPFEEPPDEFIDCLLSNEDVFDLMVGGKWNILMGPAQIDKYGNMNISVIGDWNKPKAALVGARGVPDNTTNGGRIYYLVANHSLKSFVEKVDFVCGAGHTAERKDGTLKYGAVKCVYSNLGIFDFDPKTGRMRVKSAHTGVTKQQIVENTGFELIIPDPLPETPAPTEEEVRLLREVVDPSGARRIDFATGEALQKIMGQIIGGTSYEMIYGK